MRTLFPLLLLLSCCGTKPHFPLKITASPEAFSALEHVIAEVNLAAGDEWLALGGEIFIRDVTGVSEACGEWDVLASDIYIYCFKYREQIIIHELGHALGLDHVDDKASIMYPRFIYRPTPMAAKMLVEEVTKKIISRAQ